MNRTRVFLWFVLAVLALATGADACSCDEHDYGFVVNSGTVLPANAVGVPWWSAWGPPDAGWFTVERIDGGRNESIAFHVTAAPDPSRAGSYRPLYLVAPDGGLVAGARYRFRVRGVRPVFIKGEDVAEQTIEVDVSSKRFVPGTSSATVEMDKPKIRRVTVMTQDGSCAVQVDANQAHLYFLLPEPLERWKDALQYTVVVDDSLLWNPSEDLCNRTPPGMSWLGRTEELVYSYCRRRHDTAKPAFSLPEGERKITYTAWLPGTDLSLSASTTVTLSCDEFETLDIYNMGH